MAKDIMGNILPVILIGGGGYLVWQWLQNRESEQVSQDGGVTTNGSSTSGGNYAHTGGTLTNGGLAPVGNQGSGIVQQPTQPTGISALTNLKQAIISHTGPGAELNFWQWNYQIGAVGGTDPGTLDPFVLDPQLAGMSVQEVENVLYTFDEWWSRVRGPLGESFTSQGLGGPPITTTQLMFRRGGRYGIPGVGNVHGAVRGMQGLETARASEVAVSRGIQQAQAAQARARVFKPRGPRWVN